MKLLITGGCGFLGSRLASELSSQGHEIAIIDPAPLPDRLRACPGLSHDRTSILNDDLPSVLQRAGPEVVYHLAVGLPVRESVARPLEDAELNVLGTLRVLEACRAAEVRKIVFASSGVAVYGRPERLPARETHPTRPISPYGVSKLAGEQYVTLYSHLHGLDYTILRFASVYGPGQTTASGAGAVSIFAELLLRGEVPRIFGDGSKTRDYVYVDDAVGALSASLEGGTNSILNIGRGAPITDLEVFLTVARAVGTATHPEMTPERPGDVQHLYLDSSRARALLGWEPRTDLAEGARRVVSHYREDLNP